MVPGKVFSAGHQEKNDCQARTPDCRRGQDESADSRPPGAVLWPLFLRRTADPLVRTDRTRAERSHRVAHAEAGEEAPDGAGRAGLRGGDDRGVLQHRRGDRRRWPLPRQIPQTPHSSLPSDRKSVVKGKSVALGGRRIIKKKKGTEK